MGIIRRLREWRERADGTLTGPAIDTDSVSTDALGGGITGEITLNELAGAGLEIDEQTLQILSAIWDSNESEIVADVNNQLVSTEDLDSDVATRTNVPFTVQTVDDFAHQDFNVYDDPDVSDLAFYTDPSLRDGVSLGTDSNDFGNARTGIQIWRGTLITIHVYFDEHSDQEIQRLGFHFNDVPASQGDGYSYRVDKEQDEIEIRRRDDGSTSTLATDTGLDIPTDEWLEVRCLFGWGELELDVSAVGPDSFSASTSANDTTYQNIDMEMTYTISSQETDSQTYIDSVVWRPI